MIFWWSYTLSPDINELVVKVKDIVQMDVVADFYSKPQVGGSLRPSSSRYRRRYTIPIIREMKEHVGRAVEGVAEAVSAAGGARYVSEPSKVGQKRKLFAGLGKLRHSLSDSATGSIGKSLAPLNNDDSPRKTSKKTKKKKKNKNRKHKRSRIDEVLGDDSY